PSEEARDLPIPGQWLRAVPGMTAVRQTQSPVKQIPDVRQNLTRSSRAGGGAELSEIGRRPANCFASAIGESGQSMSQQVKTGSRCGSHSQTLPYLACLPFLAAGCSKAPVSPPER